jgi:Domain of unknown function (DUF1906)
MSFEISTQLFTAVATRVAGRPIPSKGGTMPEIGGCDFAWTKPDPAATKAAGYSFVVGYLSNDPVKNLSAHHIAAYLDADLEVGLVWETTANRVLDGAPAGTADGVRASQQAAAIHYPVECVIFFAVDFDAQPAAFPTIEAYAHAFNIATPHPVGIYGSHAIIERFVTPGQQPVQYGWQTAAWSRGRLSGKAHLYQRATHTNWPLIHGVPANAFDEDVKLLDLPLSRAKGQKPQARNDASGTAHSQPFAASPHQHIPG